MDKNLQEVSVDVSSKTLVSGTNVLVSVSCQPLVIC